MSAYELRAKAKQRRSKGRLEVVASVLSAVALLVVFALPFSQTREVIPRIGYGILRLWCVYFAYQAYRWLWPKALAGDAALQTTLQWYRGELDRQRDYNRQVWNRAGLSLCVVGVAMVITPKILQAIRSPRILPDVLPFFALLLVWCVVFFFSRRGRQRKLQLEITELEGLER